MIDELSIKWLQFFWTCLIHIQIRESVRPSKPPRRCTLSGRTCNWTFLRCSIALPKQWAWIAKEEVPAEALPCGSSCIASALWVAHGASRSSEKPARRTRKEKPARRTSQQEEQEKKSQQEEQEKKSQQEEQEKKSQQTNIAMPRSFAWPQRHSPALRLCSPTGQRTQSGQAFLDVRRCLQPQIDHSASNLSKKAARYQKEQQVWLLTLAHSSLCLLSARKSGAVPHPVVSQSQTAYSRKITQTSHTKHIPNTDTYQTRTLNTRTHTDKNSCKEPQEARRPPHKAWNLQSLGG